MDETTLIQTTCSECQRIIETEVEREALDLYMMRGDTVQALFPRHSAEELEAITGHRNGSFLCHRCWAEQGRPDGKDNNGYHDTTK